MVVVKRGEEFEFNSISDLTGKRVAVNRGISYGDAFDKAVKDGAFSIHEYSRAADALHMILNNRGLDALIIGPGKYGLAAAVATDEQLNFNHFSILPVPFRVDAKHFGISKSMNMQSFIKKFNVSLKKAWDSGVAAQLVEKYLQ